MPVVNQAMGLVTGGNKNSIAGSASNYVTGKLVTYESQA